MKYQNITHDDMLNGDGIRVVLWVSGCTHRCKGCQNPMTWNADDGKEFGEEEWKEIAVELAKEHIAGITFSGGDPFHPKNRRTIAKTIRRIRASFPRKSIWLYTGYTWEEIRDDDVLKEIVKNIDVLVDGEFIENLFDSTYHWAGSTNQRIIDVKKSIREGKVVFHASN